MKKFIALLLFSTGVPLLFSAGPVMHILTAELFFLHCRPHYTQAQRDAFIRGTLFPDIRYVAGLSRGSTHKKKVTLVEVCAQTDPFTAGKLFHSYIDQLRENCAWREKMYQYVSYEKPLNKHLLKVIEDELVYKKIAKDSAISALQTFEWSDLQDGVRFYHTLIYQSNLTDYLRQSPLSLFKSRTRTKRGYLSMSLERTAEWAELLEKYAQDDRVRAYVDTFIKELDTQLILVRQKRESGLTAPARLK